MIVLEHYILYIIHIHCIPAPMKTVFSWCDKNRLSIIVDKLLSFHCRSMLMCRSLVFYVTLVSYFNNCRVTCDFAHKIKATTKNLWGILLQHVTPLYHSSLCSKKKYEDLSVNTPQATSLLFHFLPQSFRSVDNKKKGISPTSLSVFLE